MELNPKHPVTEKMRSEWHKIAALLLYKSGATSCTISVADLEDFTASGIANIVVKPVGDVLHISLVDDITALRLSEEK